MTNINDEVKKLQRDLANIDLVMNAINKRSNNKDFIELLLVKFENIKVKMYKEIKHNNPHIHIDYGKEAHKASYSIETGLRIIGNLNKKYDKTIQEFIINNKNSLLNIWENVQNGQNVECLIANIKGNY